MIGLGMPLARGAGNSNQKQVSRTGRQLALPAPPKRLLLRAPPAKPAARKRPKWPRRVPKSVEAISSHAAGGYHAVVSKWKTRRTRRMVREAMEWLRKDGVDIQQAPEVQAFDQSRRAAIQIKRAARAAKRAHRLINWISRRMKWEEHSAELNEPRDSSTPRGRARRLTEAYAKDSLAENHVTDGIRFHNADGDHYALNADSLYAESTRAVRAILAHEFEHTTQVLPQRNKMDARAYWQTLQGYEVAAFGAEAETLGTDGGPDFLWVPRHTPNPAYDAPRINKHRIYRYLRRVREVVTPLMVGAPVFGVHHVDRYLDGYRVELHNQRRFYEELPPAEPLRGVFRKALNWVRQQGAAYEHRHLQRRRKALQAKGQIGTPEEAFLAGKRDALFQLSPHDRIPAILETIQREQIP